MSLLPVVAAVSLLALAACGKGDDPSKPPPSSGPKGPPPDRVLVDHILIGVRGRALPAGKRTEGEAKAFAEDLLAKLRAGADWAAAKREHSEDPPPGGPYGMSNRGVRPANADEYPRDQMAPAFGDVSFSLAVGEIGLAAYDPRTSPFGFHIIRRLK